MSGGHPVKQDDGHDDGPEIMSLQSGVPAFRKREDGTTQRRPSGDAIRHARAMRTIRIAVPVRVVSDREDYERREAGRPFTDAELFEACDKAETAFASHPDLIRLLKVIYTDMQVRKIDGKSRVPTRGTSYAKEIREALKRAKEWP
jgi:hypothetical protein